MLFAFLKRRSVLKRHRGVRERPPSTHAAHVSHRPGASPDAGRVVTRPDTITRTKTAPTWPGVVPRALCVVPRPAVIPRTRHVVPRPTMSPRTKHAVPRAAVSPWIWHVSPCPGGVTQSNPRCHRFTAAPKVFWLFFRNFQICVFRFVVPDSSLLSGPAPAGRKRRKIQLTTKNNQTDANTQCTVL